MSNLNRTLVLTAIIGSTLLTGCASFNRCASGTGNALTSGSVVDTLMGVVFVPLIPICTGVQAFASLDAEDQQALVHGTQQIASTVAVQRAQEQELKASRIAAEEARRREQAEQEARNKASQQRQQQAAMEASGLRRSQLVARPNEGSYTPPPTNSGIQIGNAKDVAKPEQSAGVSADGGGSTDPRRTAGQMHSGNARDMSSASTPGSTARSNSGTSGQGTHGQAAGATKFQSQDATTCVEIVPKGFKCDGTSKRYMVNNCSMKIDVWFKSSGPSGSEALDTWGPKRCRAIPADFFDGYETTVQWKACTWDAKASYGPHKDPCRY